MKNRAVSRGVLAGSVLFALLAAPTVFAQSFTASNTNAVINTNGHVSTLTLDTNGVTIGGVQLVLDYNGTHITATSATSSDANLTCSTTVANRVSCGAFTPVANGTTVTIAFNVLAAEVPAPGSPLVFNADPVTGSFFFDPAFTAIPTTLNNGSVVIGTAPPDVTLAFTPAPGSTVTFPSGVALTTANASIAVAAGGTVGSGTVTGCTITGTGAASFGPPPADITVAAGASGSLPLTCTLPNSGGAATATLTCTETDSNSAGVARTWPLSCPQGTPVPGPGFGASPAPNPAPAAPITCNGQAGETVQRQITITNNGNAGAGSELTFTCSASGAASIVSGGSTTAPGLAVGASQTVVVACAVPGDGITEAGAVSCTSNAPGAPFVFNYSTTGSTFPPPVPRPAVVPASSMWSQIALIALLAGLGLAFVGFRRGQ